MLNVISNELMIKHKIKRVSYAIKNEPYYDIGWIRAYLAEGEEGKWLVVVTDNFRDEVEVLELNTRATAMKRIRERGFWTRVKNVYPSKV